MITNEATQDKAQATGAPTTEVKPTLLVVDDDRVACKYLEVSLLRTHKYNVEVAFDVAAAIETLSNCVIDLIVSDLRMPDVDGFRFINRLQRENRLRNIPVVILTTDDRLASKITGFQLGIHDYITKPFQLQELLARIHAIVQRSSLERQLLKRSYNLAGDFSGISFCDLINLFAFGQRSGILSIITPRASGKLYFVNGNLHNVGFGNLEGQEAFWAIMTQKIGQFEFCPKDFASGVPERRIHQSCMSLLMEGARRMDELGGAGSSELSPLPEGLSAASGLDGNRGARERIVAAKPVPAVVVTLEEGLSAPFTLGEFVLLTSSELARSAELPGRESRFHVVLVSDVVAGVCSMASLAAPLSEFQVAKSISESHLSVVLSFALQGGMSADVLLVNQNEPIAHLDAMRLSPSVLLIAPSEGDWLSLGVEARSDLATLVSALKPNTIVGLGNDSLAQGIREMLMSSPWQAPTHFMSGSLSEVGFDFRDALVESLRFWGKSSAELPGANGLALDK